MARPTHLSPRLMSSSADVSHTCSRTTMVKGRGARSNTSSRYEPFKREGHFDEWEIDSWNPDQEETFIKGDASEHSRIKTDVTHESPRKIINFIKSPYVPFDRSINPYRGCEHGCTYCFARPTHAYYGLSPGIDFETRLFAKPDAARLLRKEFSNPRYVPRPLAIGTNTDPYQPIEKKLRIMRSILEVLDEFQHPVSILTKSEMICRDIDFIEPMGQHRLAKAMLSITTLDPILARAMEPRASAPHRRLEAVRRLSNAGAIVGVMTAPMIPGLNDDEMESILEAAKDAGAQFAGYTIIRLPMEVSTIFREWIETTFPDKAKRVMRHIHEMNGGRDYDPQWTRATTPRSVYAKLITNRFEKAIRRLNLNRKRTPLNVNRFAIPKKPGDQMDLF